MKKTNPDIEGRTATQLLKTGENSQIVDLLKQNTVYISIGISARATLVNPDARVNIKEPDIRESLLSLKERQYYSISEIFALGMLRGHQRGYLMKIKDNKFQVFDSPKYFDVNKTSKNIYLKPSIDYKNLSTLFKTLANIQIHHWDKNEKGIKEHEGMINNIFVQGLKDIASTLGVDKDIIQKDISAIITNTHFEQNGIGSFIDLIGVGSFAYHEYTYDMIHRAQRDKEQNHAEETKQLTKEAVTNLLYCKYIASINPKKEPNKQAETFIGSFIEELPARESSLTPEEIKINFDALIDLLKNESIIKTPQNILQQCQDYTKLLKQEASIGGYITNILNQSKNMEPIEFKKKMKEFFDKLQYHKVPVEEGYYYYSLAEPKDLNEALNAIGNDEALGQSQKQQIQLTFLSMTNPTQKNTIESFAKRIGQQPTLLLGVYDASDEILSQSWKKAFYGQLLTFNNIRAAIYNTNTNDDSIAQNLIKYFIRACASKESSSKELQAKLSGIDKNATRENILSAVGTMIDKKGQEQIKPQKDEKKKEEPNNTLAIIESLFKPRNLRAPYQEKKSLPKSIYKTAGQKDLEQRPLEVVLPTSSKHPTNFTSEILSLYSDVQQNSNSKKDIRNLGGEGTGPWSTKFAASLQSKETNLSFREKEKQRSEQNQGAQRSP